MIRDFVARTTGADTEVAPETLLCQGVAAMIFLLGVAVLQGLLWLPLAWRDGEFARLVGLLWAVPAAALMSARYAAEKLDILSASRYLRRMDVARLGAILLALVVFPVAQWHFVDGQRDWVTPALAYPIVASFALCLGASVAASHLGVLWFQLPLHPSERQDRSPEWGEVRPRVWIDRPLIVARFWRWWLAGALAICGALAVHQYAPDRLGVPQFWGVLAFLAYLGLGPLLIGQAARSGRRAQWQLDGVAISREVLEDWGARGFTLTVLAIGGACLAAVAGLFGLLHRGAQRLASLLGLSQPHGPGHLSASTGSPAQPSDSGIGGTGAWTGQSGGHAQGGWGFDLHISLHLPPSFLLLIVALAALGWSLVWARRHESHGIARWLLLAAVADMLLAYLGWLRKAVPSWIAAGRLHAQAPSDSGRKGSRPHGRRAVAEPTTPRQAVIARYLATLEHAARRGYARRPGQTPHQFAADLRAGLRRERGVPEAMAALFTAARFSPRPCADRDAARMDQLWRSVRRNLRRR